MLTVRKSCADVDKWNKNATCLVKELEETIAGFSRIFLMEKENVQPKKRKIPVKAFQILTEHESLSRKADTNTLQKMIRTGIYNLRKSNSPMLSSPSFSESQIQSNCSSNRSSSMGPLLKLSKKLTKKPSKAKKRRDRGRSHDRCIQEYTEKSHI